MSRDEVVRQFAPRFLEASKLTESFGVNYCSESSVTGQYAAPQLLDNMLHVSMPHHSIQSQGVLCHGHSPTYMSQALHIHVTLSLQ